MGPLTSGSKNGIYKMNPPSGPEVDTLYTVTVNRHRVEPVDVSLEDVILCIGGQCAQGQMSVEFNVWNHATVTTFLEKLRQHVHHLSHDFYESSLHGDSAIGTITQDYDFEDGLGTLTFGHHVPKDIEQASAKYPMSRLVDMHASYEDDGIGLSLSMSCEDPAAHRPPNPFVIRSEENDSHWWRYTKSRGTVVYSMDVYIKPQSFRRRDFVKFEKRHYPNQSAVRTKKRNRIKDLRDSGFMDSDTADRLMDV